jgi:hypothetical protein
MHDGFIEDYEICGMKFQEFAIFSYFLGSLEKVEEMRWRKYEYRYKYALSETGLWTACPPQPAQEGWTLATAEPVPRRWRACHAEAFSVGGLDINFLK